MEERNFEEVKNEGPEASSPKEHVETGKDVTDADDLTSYEPVRVVSPSIPEKVVFCVDAHFHAPAHLAVLNIINSYIELKERIAIKSVEFAILLLGDKVNNYFEISTKKSVTNIMLAITKLEVNDSEPYDFSGVFSDLAKHIQLPDPNFYGEDLPPPHVYHFIILFGRNHYVPFMKSCNTYYFLIESPYVALDILFLHKNDSKVSLRNKIGKALKGLVDENKGFFLSCSSEGDILEYSRVIRRFLGHPLIRFPQKSALFGYQELCN